ncbi:MAG: hypothetical protein ACTSXK_17485, partial [Promethearchaeota archaeon]
TLNVKYQLFQIVYYFSKILFHMSEFSFSKDELKSVGLSVADARKRKYKVDMRRKSCKEESLDELKKLGHQIKIEIPKTTRTVQKRRRGVVKTKRPAPPKKAPKAEIKKPKAPKKKKVAPKKEKPVPKKEVVAPKKEKPVPKKEVIAPKKEKPAPKKEVVVPKNDFKVNNFKELKGMAPRFITRLEENGITTISQLVETDDIKDLAKKLKSTQKIIREWKLQITGEKL